MNSDRAPAAILKLVPKVVGLLLFGIYFERVFDVLTSDMPRQIFFESSFTAALLSRMPLGIAVAIASVALMVWLFSPAGRGHLAWDQVDRVGGLRWPILVVAMTLAWAYAGYRYNYYFDQSHVWDRWLIVALLFATLRSPLLIPFFVFEVLLSRAQFDHPLNAVTHIGDELSLRVLGVVVGCALWNALQDGLKAVRSIPRTILFEKWLDSARIPTHAVVYSVLCMIGFYYVVAGLGKMTLGLNAFDWMRFSHLENLFVASYLNGWLHFLSESRMLELAEFIRILHLPISMTTLMIELGMSFILVRRRGTLLILAAASAMHVGIVVTTGIIFWKWLALDFSFLVWLWLRREDEEIGCMYSPSKFILSVLVIGGLVAGFQLNKFSWWNTKWIMIYEVEVLDEEGKSYLVDHADFSPYAFFDVYRPRGRRNQTRVYGLTLHQHLMNFFEEADPDSLKKFGSSGPGRKISPDRARRARRFNDFMSRYFRNRNRDPGQSVPPFLLPSPAMHNRHLHGPNLYKDQGPVIEVRLRFKEFYYSGSELRRMRDEIVYSIPIANSVPRVDE